MSPVFGETSYSPQTGHCTLLNHRQTFFLTNSLFCAVVSGSDSERSLTDGWTLCWLCDRIRSSEMMKLLDTLHFTLWVCWRWVINAQEVTFDPRALFSLSLTRRNAEKQSRISRYSTLYELLDCKDGAKGDTGKQECFWDGYLLWIDAEVSSNFGWEGKKTSSDAPQKFLRAAANRESSELSCTVWTSKPPHAHLRLKPNPVLLSALDAWYVWDELQHTSPRSQTAQTHCGLSGFYSKGDVTALDVNVVVT